MKTPLDLWEEIGAISEEELPLVLTKLFSFYDTKLANDPQDREALEFFKNLSSAISQTLECNLNRR
jgi:hypothetical protein